MPEVRGGQRRAELLHQHGDLRHLFDQLEANASRPAEAVPLLGSLREALGQHFADEEGEEGLAQAVGASAPWSLRRLDELLAEHRSLLEALDRLIAQAQGLLEGQAAFAGATRALLRRLRQHEERETALLSEAVHYDLGGG
jgi:hypothetical protein